MIVNRDECVGCGACVNLCPRLAIRFIDNKSYIDQASCIECGTCRASCGVEAIYSGCRFPDVLLLNFSSNPFEEGDNALKPSEKKRQKDALG
jgi:Fe-S-cluster-containing hydrogenase component 2